MLQKHTSLCNLKRFEIISRDSRFGMLVVISCFRSAFKPVVFPCSCFIAVLVLLHTLKSIQAKSSRSVRIQASFFFVVVVVVFFCRGRLWFLIIQKKVEFSCSFCDSFQSSTKKVYRLSTAQYLSLLFEQEKIDSRDTSRSWAKLQIWAVWNFYEWIVS